MGTTYVQELKDAGGIEVVELDTTPLVVQDILNGRLAAGLFDAAQAAVFISNNDKLEMHTLRLCMPIPLPLRCLKALPMLPK